MGPIFCFISLNSPAPSLARGFISSRSGCLRFVMIRLQEGKDVPLLVPDDSAMSLLSVIYDSMTD